MEGTKKNDEPTKTADDSISHPVTSSNRQPEAESTSGGVPGPAGDEMTEPVTAQAPEKQADAAAVTGEPANTARKSKKLAKAIKKLKEQKKEVASLEKKRENLVKDLVSAIEKSKKSKQIMSMAKEFRRYEKQTRNKSKAYLRAKRKLSKKLQ